MTVEEILNNYISKKEKVYGKTEKMKKFEKIRSHKVSKKTLEYLKPHFDHLKIKILDDCEGNIMDLMKKEKLNGWCWGTTETAILFLNDNSYIQRGNLKFDEEEIYYHSWIIFKFKGKEYTFDPCLNLLCKKTIFDRVFEVEVKGQVSAKEVKEYFISYVTNPPKKELSKEKKEYSERIKKILASIIGEEALNNKGEIMGPDQTDINDPMYRNDVGYKAKIENGKVKQLVAHYYK